MAFWDFVDQFSVDLAYVYLDNTNETFDISGAGFGPGANVSTDHEENSVSFQLAYKF